MPGLTRDVRKIGHLGTGDLEITIASDADFERAKPLLDREGWSRRLGNESRTASG